MAKGVEAMLVVTTELGCVLCPLYISCDKTIDVTGETSSNSTGSVFIWKKKKKKESELMSILSIPRTQHSFPLATYSITI